MRTTSGIDVASAGDTSWLWLNLALSFIFIIPALWLYKNLSYKTKKRWIKDLIMDNGGRQIRSAFQFLEDIEQFKANV